MATRQNNGGNPPRWTSIPSWGVAHPLPPPGTAARKRLSYLNLIVTGISLRSDSTCFKFPKETHVLLCSYSKQNLIITAFERIVLQVLFQRNFKSSSEAKLINHNILFTECHSFLFISQHIKYCSLS